MTQEEWAEMQFINQQLEHMEQLGIIKNLRTEVGDSLLTSSVKFSVDEEMLPLILKENNPTIH